MFHIPIINTKDTNRIIEFSHTNEDTPSRHWRKENIISLKNIKINVFLEGSFSFFTDSKSYTPTYGDICVLSPYKMHSAQITNPTHTDYFQFDIGTMAFNSVPDGDKLLKRLIDYSKQEGAFFRPKEKYIKQAIAICNSAESAISKQNNPLAFAKSIEFVSLLCEIYEQSENVPANILSRTTKNTIEYIHNNFSEDLNVDSLARLENVSRSYLSRIFKKETGMGIHEYITRYRITKASYLLRTHSVSEVCYMCSFSDSSHFISVFKKHLGCTPLQYKKRNQPSLI